MIGLSARAMADGEDARISIGPCPEGGDGSPGSRE
jgi:hypothetical protein